MNLNTKGFCVLKANSIFPLFPPPPPFSGSSPLLFLFSPRLSSSWSGVFPLFLFFSTPPLPIWVQWVSLCGDTNNHSGCTIFLHPRDPPLLLRKKKYNSHSRVLQLTPFRACDPCTMYIRILIPLIQRRSHDSSCYSGLKMSHNLI